MEGFRDKLEEELPPKIMDELRVDEEEALRVKVVEQQTYRFEHSPDYIDKLGRIKGIKEAEVEGKRILCKFSLKVKMQDCS